MSIIPGPNNQLISQSYELPIQIPEPGTFLVVGTEEDRLELDETNLEGKGVLQLEPSASFHIYHDDYWYMIGGVSGSTPTYYASDIQNDSDVDGVTVDLALNDLNFSSSLLSSNQSLSPVTFESGISTMLAGRAGLPLSTDIPAATFHLTSSISGSSVDYTYNTTSVKRLGLYAQTIVVSGSSFQENIVNSESGSQSQPFAVEFDTNSPEIFMPFVSNTNDARIWCLVDGFPISEMAPDQVVNISAGNIAYYRLRFPSVQTRRIRLYLVACCFGGVSVPTGYDIVANPKSEVRRMAFVGDSWGGESGRMKFPYVIPYMVGKMIGWETAHCSIGGTGYVNGKTYGDSSRLAGLSAFAPHYIVVEGSINDTSYSESVIFNSSSAYYLAISSSLPSTKIIVVGPQPVSNYETSVNLAANRNAVKSASLSASNVIAFIDPIEGKWFRGTGNIDSSYDVQSGSVVSLLDSDNIHTTVGGGSSYSQRIVEGIFRSLEQNELIRQTAGANEVVPTSPSLEGFSPSYNRITSVGGISIKSSSLGLRIYESSDINNSSYFEQIYSGNQLRIRTRSTGSGTARAINISTQAGAEIDLAAAASTNGSIILTQGSTSVAGAVHTKIIGTFTGTSGAAVSGLLILPTINQSGTAGATDIRINRTQTSVGSGTQLFIDAQLSGVSKFYVDNSGSISANHLMSSGSTPSISAGVGAGTGASVSITGTDTAGQITINAGTLPSLDSIISTITFSSTYQTSPYVILWPSNQNASSLGFLPYVSGSTSNFTINNTVSLGLTESTEYKYNYHVIR